MTSTAPSAPRAARSGASRRSVARGGSVAPAGALAALAAFTALTALAWGLVVRVPSARAAGRQASGPVGSLLGQVTAPAALAGSGGSAPVPVGGVTVTVTGPSGTTYTTATTADGYYALDDLPAPATYAVAFAAGAPPAPTLAQTTASVGVAGVASAGAQLPGPVATITGAVDDPGGRPVPGTPVALVPAGTTCATDALCGVTTAAGADGTFTLTVPAGGYRLLARDAGADIDERAVTATAGASIAAPVRLAPAPVPAGTVAHGAQRDLRRLNAQRLRLGLPAGITLDRRWSSECAAHDAYERINGVLSGTENPVAPDASAGGAWAALNGVLAQSTWTATATPWNDAPIHLLALYAPSLSVVGIDDDDGRQCVTTYPGLLRAPVADDTVTTYPADGARGVPVAEVAHESPSADPPAGIPAGATTGRNLFVYLERAHETGQAPVTIVSASLTVAGQPVALRWVDSTTATIGRYLTGAILIPVRPLRHDASYTATVTVRDRSGTLSRSWRFQTG